MHRSRKALNVLSDVAPIHTAAHEAAFSLEKHMGRSVSYANRSEHIAYSHIEQDAYYCSHCGETFNEYGQQDEEDCCPNCAASADDCYPQDASDDWDWYVEDFQREMKRAFPSMSECDEWVGREDHALLENQYAFFGVSEYCGLVSMWVQPKDPHYSENESWEARRDHWISQIGPKFYKVASTCFGTALRKMGTFSNGESVYQAIAA